ncbi:MAG TPA: protein kinase, partial [Candidatus Thermoplasmatota archaeon]
GGTGFYGLNALYFVNLSRGPPAERTLNPDGLFTRGQSTTLATRDGIVYATAGSEMVALSAETGDVLWATTPPGSATPEFWAREGLVPTRDVLYARTRALEPGSCAGGNVSAAGTPLSAGKPDEYRSSVFYALDPSDGSPVWRFELAPVREFSPIVKIRDFSFAVADGVMAIAGADGTLTVLGQTDASVQPRVHVSSVYPQLGENVTANLTNSGPGAFGPATEFRADWGDGTDSGWGVNPVLTHRFAAIQNAQARFYVRNVAGQTASVPFVFFVGVPLPTPSAPAESAVAKEGPAVSTNTKTSWIEQPFWLAMIVVAGITVLGVPVLVRGRHNQVHTPRYVVERELGRGSHSKAILARDTVLERHVVLKQPIGSWLSDKKDRASFVKEARRLAQLHHPNVVSIFEFLDKEEPPVLVLEYAAGGSLETLLRNEHRLPRTRALEIALEVLAGLDHIHSSGIVHRDLKPSNILLDELGLAKISDFGVASTAHNRAGEETVGVEGFQPGTPYYMSPEQARGRRVDARADLYALAVILFEMLTGEHYLRLENILASDVGFHIVRDKPRLPHPQVPTTLGMVLMRGLAK